MTDSAPVPDIYKKHLPELNVLLHHNSISPLYLKNTLERIIQISDEIKSHPAVHTNEKFTWWLDKLTYQANQFLKDISELLPFLSAHQDVVAQNGHSKSFTSFPS